MVRLPRFRIVSLGRFCRGKNDGNDSRKVFRRQIQIPAALQHTYHPRQNRFDRDSSRNDLLKPGLARSLLARESSARFGSWMQLLGIDGNHLANEIETPVDLYRSFLRFNCRVSWRLSARNLAFKRWTNLEFLFLFDREREIDR